MSDYSNPAEVLPPAPAVAAEARLARLRRIGYRLSECLSLDAALPILAELMVMVVEAPYVVARELELRPVITITNSPRAAEADERRPDQPVAATAPDADPSPVQPDLSGIGGRGEPEERKPCKPRRSSYVGSAAWWRKRSLAKVPDDRDHDAQVADFVARRGVTQCPPAFATPSPQGERQVSSIPPMTWDPLRKRWGRFG